MEEQTVSPVSSGTTKLGTTLTDLKLRVAEHIIKQDDCYRPDEVQGILAETKVGARRRTDLLKKLRMVFSTS